MSQNKKMVWSRLKSMRCPNCNGHMAENHLTRGIECQDCSMFIRKEKFDELVASLYTKKVGNYQDENLEALNNL